jgi:hypothetical protein
MSEMIDERNDDNNDEDGVVSIQYEHYLQG